MKKFRKVISALLAVAIVSSFATVAMAAKITADGVYEIFTIPAEITQGTTTFTVGMGICEENNTDISMAANAEAFANLFFAISEEALAQGIVVTDITSDVGTVGEYLWFDPTGEDNAFGTDVIFDTQSVELNKSVPIINVTFSINADAELGTYYMTTDGEYDEAQMSDGTNDTGLIPLGDRFELVTVKSAGPVGPTVEEGETFGDIVEYTFENSEEFGEDVKVLMTTQAAAVTRETRFYASYDGAPAKEFGSNIWEKLGNPGEGTITINNIKFGLIVPAGLDASKFTFEVCAQK